MQKFLEPESVTLIGAPRKMGLGSYNGVEMMLRYGYKGRIYPVNPKAHEICGLKVYSSVTAVPEPADLAIISLERDGVTSALKECIQSGIRRVIIVSQGFADGDQHGSELQNEITTLAHESGVRVLGPNSLGVLNNFQNFRTGFIDHPKPAKVPPISLVAQTGMIQLAAERFSYHAWGKAIDIGNACDVNFVDALDYLGDDPETKVIVLHLEGVLRGRNFIECASKVSLKKPIVVFKTGRSKAGAKAALSHTGLLVGEDEVYDAGFRRAGIIRVKNASEMRAAVRALIRFGGMGGPRLGVLTPSGAGGIMATDACEDFGLTIAEMPEGLMEKLKKGIPRWFHINNPMDIWPAGGFGAGYPQAYKQALTEMLKSPEIDGILAIAMNPDSPLHKDIDPVQFVTIARQETGSRKPIAILEYGSGIPAAVDRLEAIDSVACFGSIEQAVQGLSFCYRYHEIKRRKFPEPRTFTHKSKSAAILLQKGRKQKALLGQDALALLSAFGILVVRGNSVRKWDELEKAAEAFDYPLVLKLSGEAFLHKSEWGGVATGIRNKKELREAFKRITENVSRRDPNVRMGFQLQEQATGKELLLGLKRDPNFGPVLACGLGGIYTEVFQDISRELVPIGRGEAEKMVRSLKSYPLLKGVRGEAGIDFEGLLDALERLSFLATKIPDIAELDINPLMADASGCKAVDARVLW